MPPEVIDQVAREIAREALAKLGASEQMNQERWHQVEKSLSSVGSTLKELNSRVTRWVLSTAAAIILILLGTIGWLINQLYSIPHR